LKSLSSIANVEVDLGRGSWRRQLLGKKKKKKIAR